MECFRLAGGHWSNHVPASHIIAQLWHFHQLARNQQTSKAGKHMEAHAGGLEQQEGQHQPVDQPVLRGRPANDAVGPGTLLRPVGAHEAHDVHQGPHGVPYAIALQQAEAATGSSIGSFWGTA